jgi:2-polyprenyl-3-methyl-5-hydroxy-6-metoxy-1,4-benzoquinol methylase
LLLPGATSFHLPGKHFDMICCVNALHHFDNPKAFLVDVAALLDQNGRLAVIGIDPRTIRHR